MTFQDLGAIGEFVGSILILATLVYLAIQTRQSKVAAELESVRMVVADFNDIWIKLSEDPELAKLVRMAVNDWDSITTTQQFQVNSFFVPVFLHWVSARRQSAKIVQLKDYMEGWEENVLALITTPGGKVWYDSAKVIFRPDDIQYLDQRLDSGSNLPPSWIDTLPWMRVNPIQE